MFANDPYMSKRITGFMLTTGLGLLGYVAVELWARWISTSPRDLYANRLICLTIFFVFLAVVYLPSTAEAYTGSRDRAFRLGVGAKSMGVGYGVMTWFSWFLVAFLEWPRKARGGEAEPGTPPNGGPSKRCEGSEATERPPSVS
jgi:hypothetical protein